MSAPSLTRRQAVKALALSGMALGTGRLSAQAQKT